MTSIDTNGKRVRKVRMKQPAPLPTRELVLVGLGGIGSWLLQAIAPILAYDKQHAWTLVLVDGDDYETKNHVRQAFELRDIGEKKATAQAYWVRNRFLNLNVQAFTSYLTHDNLGSVLHERSIILLAVDNHATRKMVSDYVGCLDDAVLISAGNDELDGNVQVYVRSEGQDVTPSLTAYHPEIAHPADKLPGDLSCEEKLAAGSSQTLCANFFAASLALNAFWKSLYAGNSPRVTEVYFDCHKNAAISRDRPVPILNAREVQRAS